MDANLDMNFYRVTNLTTAVNNSEPVTLAQANILASVTNPLTQNSVGDVLYPKTAAETTAGVTIVNSYIEPGHVLRYGTNTTPGTTDMATAINNAIKVALNGGSKLIKFQSEVYLVGATIEPTAELFGLILQGQGSLATTIKASHSEGPVIHLNRSNSGLRGMTIDATTARNTGSATSTGGTYKDNVGVLFEAADISGKAVASQNVDDLRIINQPSHGLLSIGASQESRYNNLLVQDNKGHGAVCDQGTINARTNKADPGITTLTNFWSIDNSGNGFVGGNPSDAVLLGSFRFLFHNAELDGNATDATVRHSQDQVWLSGENHTFICPAFGGNSVSGGMRFAGKDLVIINPRFVSCTDSLSLGAHPVLDECTGVTVENMRVLNVAQDPAIIIEDITKVKDVRVTLANIGNVTNAFTDGAIGCTMSARGDPITIVRKAANGAAVNNSTTLINDPELFIPLAASETVSFEAMLRYLGDATADIKITFTAPSGATIRWQPESSVYVGPTDAVSVKTGDVIQGTTLAFGTNSGTRIIKVVGHIVMSTTSGKLQLQWAQNSAVTADTSILSGSTLRVIRNND